MDVFDASYIDYIYDHIGQFTLILEILSENLKLNNLNIQRLNLLKILVLIMQKLKQASKVLSIKSKIGFFYIDRGYQFIASNIFVECNKLLASGNCSIESQLEYLVYYGLYLYYIGNITKRFTIIILVGPLCFKLLI